MNEYQKLLREIEAKKQDLESRIAVAVQAEVSKFQSENDMPVEGVYIHIIERTEMGESKRYEVTSASVDLDYKP